MEINSKVIDGVRIVYVSGNIILEETNKARAYLKQIIENPTLKGLIINCKKVEYIDSSGLGLIVSIYKTLKKRNKQFALSAMSNKAMEIFVLTRLNEILIIADSDESALESFHI